MEMCKLGGILHPLERRRLAREMEGRSNSTDSKERGGWRTEYREVTLMMTLYKVYMLILVERLEEVVEEKGLFPPNHIRYRKGMGALDNVYIVNYLINRQLSR